MSKETKIQWCDSTVNPIMGCGGCELFPSPGKVLAAVDEAVATTTKDWSGGKAQQRFASLITEAYAAIDKPSEGHRKAVTTTNIWHFRERFYDLVREQYGSEAQQVAKAVIEREITCYAAKQHMNRSYSLLSPERGTNPGYAPTFEQVTHFKGRVPEAAQWHDLLGTKDPDREWIDGLPRLIFVSDMGDAFSRKKDFPFLQSEVIDSVKSEDGRRQLWLWLTKRPRLMAEFTEEQGELPDNICAMTTVTGPDPESLKRIDDLRRVNASVRGLSLEPIWERIPPEKLDLRDIDWVILGGENGSSVEHSRPFALEWAEELRDYCREKGVAYFLKQLGRRPTRGGDDLKLKDSHGGDWSEWPSEALRVREFPKAFYQYREGEISTGGLRRIRKGEMTPSDAEDFKRLDKIVSGFAKDTITAADAIYQIRDRKLYRGKYKTFSDYCESVHEISRQYANRLIKAGEIRAKMVPIVSKLGLPEPENEGQLRELARVSSPEERTEVYREAVEQATSKGDKVTARLIDEVRRQRLSEATAQPGDEEPRLTPSQRLSRAHPLLEQLESTLREREIESDVLEELKTLLEV